MHLYQVFKQRLSTKCLEKRAVYRFSFQYPSPTQPHLTTRIAIHITSDHSGTDMV